MNGHTFSLHYPGNSRQVVPVLKGGIVGSRSRRLYGNMVRNCSCTLQDSSLFYIPSEKSLFQSGNKFFEHSIKFKRIFNLNKVSISFHKLNIEIWIMLFVQFNIGREQVGINRFKRAQNFSF